MSGPRRWFAHAGTAVLIGAGGLRCSVAWGPDIEPEDEA